MENTVGNQPLYANGVASKFRGDIQGLRAVAVLLVVIYHGGVTILAGGYIGVDVFFVISGFLITSLLWREVADTRRLNFAVFYARRARRILPAALVVIVAAVVAGVIFLPPLRIPAMFSDAIASALYVPNFQFALNDTNYLAETAPSPFQHYWSLGIEEQFYLLWPFVLVCAAVWFGRGSLRWAVTAAGTLTVASFVACVWLTPRSEVWAFFFPGTRVWEFGVGALIAFLAAWRPLPVSRSLGSALAAFGLAVIFVTGFAFDSRTPFPGFMAALPVLGTALVIVGGLSAPHNLAARILSIRPMQFLGNISYSLYLVHWPMLVIPQSAVGLQNELHLWVSLTLAASSIPIAWILFRLVEDPVRRASLLAAARPSRMLVVTACITALVVAGAHIGRALSADRILETDAVAAPYNIQLNPVGEAAVPNNLVPSLWEVADNLPETYTNGCHVALSESIPVDCVVGENPDAPLVTLFGDSHAAQWYPALAQLANQGLIRLESQTKSGCQSLEMPSVPSCRKWRERVIEKLRKKDGGVVLISNYDYGEIYSEESLEHGLTNISDALAPHTRVLRIVDNPRPRWTPSICLSANLDAAHNCDLYRSRALGRADGEVSGIPVIDLTDFFCNSVYCPVIIGNLLVYRDDSHITASFAEALSPVFRDKLEHENLPSRRNR